MSARRFCPAAGLAPAAAVAVGLAGCQLIGGAAHAVSGTAKPKPVLQVQNFFREHIAKQRALDQHIRIRIFSIAIITDKIVSTYAGMGCFRFNHAQFLLIVRLVYLLLAVPS